MHEYVFISDPGHGWLQVPRHEVKALDFKASNFSYSDPMHLYLEEDYDAPRFLKAWEAAYGEPLEYEEKHYDKECFVRRLSTVPKYLQEVKNEKNS